MVFKIVLMPRTINAGSIFPGTCKEDWANINLEINPEKSGTPTMDKEPIVNHTPAIIFRYPAPVRSANFLLSLEASVIPTAEIKRRAFEAAWEKI